MLVSLFESVTLVGIRGGSLQEAAYIGSLPFPSAVTLSNSETSILNVP